MRSSSRAALVAAFALMIGGLSAVGAPAQAADPVTVSFAYTGGVQTWTVPAGVTSARFTLTGASGGDAGDLGAEIWGGRGGVLQATLPVQPGDTLAIRVGGKGDSIGFAGYNGGAAGPTGLGAGGGGATDVRPVGGDLASRLLVAGGGGGAGQNGPLPSNATGTPGAGGAGGDAGSDGANGGHGYRDGELLALAGNGGKAGTASAGGAGGASGYTLHVVDQGKGNPGGFGVGGAPAALDLDPDGPYLWGGGAGGGGWYGGGAGGSGTGHACEGCGFGVVAGSGGGGGGSSHAVEAATDVVTGIASTRGHGSVSITYTVDATPALTPQSISFPTPADAVLLGPDVALTASATSGLPVTYTSQSPSVCSIVNGKAHPIAAGTCAIAANQAGDDTYAAAPQVIRTLTVSKAPQTISHIAPGDVEIGAGPTTLLFIVQASSGLPVTLTSTTPSVCTITPGGGAAVLQASGTCTITVNQAGDATYAAAPEVAWTFRVRRAQTITFEQPDDVTTGSGPVPLSASASSGLPVAFTSQTPAVCTVAAGAASAALVGTGTCTIAANQAGDDTYAAAAEKTRSFTVGKKSQSITFAAPGDAVYGGDDVALSASASSGLPVTFTSLSAGVCSVVAGKARPVGPGTCVIAADQAGDNTWDAAERVTRSLTVAKADQVISFPQPADGVYGGDDIPLSASTSSGLPVTLSSSTPEVCSIVEGKARPLAAGTCVVTASQGGNLYYSPAASVGRFVTVAKASQVIDFVQPADGVYGGDDISLSATASSGLAVSFSTTTPGTCLIVSGKVRPVAAGTCVVTATQAGSANYSAATSVTRSLTVSKASQSIWFNQPDDVVLGAGSIALAATASSGLAVAFSSLTPGVCTVATGASTAVPVAVGECRVAADQAGDANHAAANQVVRTVQVLAPACSDGVDNDGNGAADYPADFGCTSELDNSESSPVACAPTTKTGTSAMNIILGTFGDDTVLAGGGADTVYGYSGVDCLAGEDGNDTLWGGSDTDQLLGGAGNDNLYGEGDDDVLYCGAGDDFLDGGFGDDRLNGGPGADTLWGGFGDDTIYAVDGAKDTIDCGFGTDTVYADPVDKVTGCETIIRRTP